MQGLELVERLLNDQPEITFKDPTHANSKKHPFPFERWIKQPPILTPGLPDGGVLSVPPLSVEHVPQ